MRSGHFLLRWFWIFITVIRTRVTITQTGEAELAAHVVNWEVLYYCFFVIVKASPLLMQSAAWSWAAPANLMRLRRLSSASFEVAQLSPVVPWLPAHGRSTSGVSEKIIGDTFWRCAGFSLACYTPGQHKFWNTGSSFKTNNPFRPQPSPTPCKVTRTWFTNLTGTWNIWTCKQVMLLFSLTFC